MDDITAIKDAQDAISIIKTQKSIERNNSYDETCKNSPIYRSTNELSSGFMEDIVSSGSRILTVAASGDQYLNCILYGATKVDTFDINMLTFYHTILKTISAKVLSLEEYKEFLMAEAFSSPDNCQNFMNKKIYNKVSPYLPHNVKDYFDTIYYLIKKEKLISPFEILYLDGNYTQIESRCPYLELSNYKRLKRLLENKELPSFTLGDITKILPRLKGNYDGMIFSNIMDYTECDLETEVYKNGLPHLTDNGTIELSYVWGDIKHDETYGYLEYDELGITPKKIYEKENTNSYDTVLLMKKRW